MIETANEYYEAFNDQSRAIEDLLEKCRPHSKPARTSCLFVFESLVPARKHWSKMTGGKLYRVQVDKQSLLHRADMNLMDEMRVADESAQDMRPIAERYWKGEESRSPEIELLVRFATVVEVLSISESERKAHLRERSFGPGAN